MKPITFTDAIIVTGKKTGLLKSKVPSFEIKTKVLTFQNTRPLKTGAYPFAIRCLLLCHPVPVRFFMDGILRHYVMTFLKKAKTIPLHYNSLCINRMKTMKDET